MSLSQLIYWVTNPTPGGSGYRSAAARACYISCSFMLILLSFASSRCWKLDPSSAQPANARFYISIPSEGFYSASRFTDEQKAFSSQLQNNWQHTFLFRYFFGCKNSCVWAAIFIEWKLKWSTTPLCPGILHCRLKAPKKDT